MLDDYWNQQFDDAYPIAHSLRDSRRDCWVRFHSLPKSKRYPKSDTEWTTLLERHNAVLAALASDGSKLELLTTNWSDANSPGPPHERFCKLQIPSQHWRTVAMHELDGDPEPNYWHIFRSTITWTNHALDDLIRLVADDYIPNVMILDPTDSWLLHPYDGGMDVILGSIANRDGLSNRFSDWRSSRSDGL